MQPILTVGVTTHNERENIKGLLDRLAQLDENRFQIVLFDDASVDGTASLISQHPLSRKHNFGAHLADTNFGSPSVGRQYIAQHARSPYVTFVDGDDLIDPEALTIVAGRLKPGLDIVVTPFMSGRRREFPSVFNNEKPISDYTISRLLSGIGGKIYNREALILHTKDEIKGRSEDVRLNIRILLGGFDRVRFEETKPFYFIASSRKSTFSRNILLHEIAARVQNYQVLKERYGVDDTYVRGLHRNLLKVVREDPVLSHRERLELYKSIHDVMPFRAATLVHLSQNPIQEDGLSEQIHDIVLAAKSRGIQHVCLSARHDFTNAEPSTLYAEEDEAAVLAFLSARHATDTVVLTPNNTIRSFSPAIREQLGRLPILHIASSPLSQTIETSEALADLDYLDTYKVARVLCLSDLDMSFHRQMGIYDVTKVRLPVATRSHNTYSPDKNRFATYVGRIDFHAKGADRLIPIARLMKERGLPPLHIFTTDGRNSPDLPVFLDQVAKADLSDWVRITYNVTDKPTLYDQASVVLLPSRKEAFGNVILEAFSFGVPVIAPSYAPGPAEIICSGQDGYLLEEYTAEAVVDLLEGLSKDKLAGLSQAAFARHQEYSMEQYLASLEAIAAEVAQTFPGRNEVRPFPHIKAVEHLIMQPISIFLRKRYRVKERISTLKILLVERVLPRRIVKVLLLIKRRLS